MIAEAIAIGGLGMLAALGLGVAARVFYVETDPLVDAIEEALPGANCGGCGFAGCSTAAEAIAADKMSPSGCVGGGPEVAVEVSAIMGVEVVESEPDIARLGCRYPAKRADLKFNYSGLSDCRAATLLSGGAKECPIGCLGLGSCAAACPFDAIYMGPDGLPVVEEYKCTGCGTCERTCPQGIMKLSSVSRRIVGEYQYDDCTAPCQRTCPAGIDIPNQIFHTAMGDYGKALLTIKERNPLPLICGRICPRPCESECRRNMSDQPVAINYLKRFVADHERQSGERLQPFKAPDTGKKLAVIGGGVQGLTAANYLARLGHSPSLYEALPKLGGLLRTAIPASRLPREVLDWEIDGILEMGVKAHTSTAFGKDISLCSLFAEGNLAVLLATGGWDSLLMRGDLPAPAPALPSVMLALPLTMAWAARNKVDLGPKVAIIGGGKQGLTLAKKAKEEGASEVTILWRRDRDAVGLERSDIDAAGKDGIKASLNSRVTRIMGKGDALTQLAYTDINPMDGEPAERVIEVDSIIAASGRLPDMIFAPTNLPDDEEETIAPEDITWETVMPYSGQGAALRGMFDTDEPVSDYRAAVEAIGAGRRAASSMHQYLYSGQVAAPQLMITQPGNVLDVNALINLNPAGPRQPMPEASDQDRLDPSLEIELGYDLAAAKEEAKRCLNCGLLCYYRTSYH